MSQPWRIWAPIALFLALALPAPAPAGQLVLRNDSNAPVTCTVDGWTISTGFSFDWQITVQPGQKYYVGQNFQRGGPQVINWADCGGLRTRAMNITPTSPDGQLILNGQQSRVLNASLYPYIPTLPGTKFEPLVTHVIETYQAANPAVLLAAQLNAETDIYSFTELPELLGADGLDVIEMDVLYLGYVVAQNLVNPAAIAGEQPLPVALDASTIDGQLWGVPSWLCMNFMFARDAGVQQATTLAALLQFLGQLPSDAPKLVANYNGSWTLPSMYINAYVQAHGYGEIAKAMQMPPDDAVIGNLVELTDSCAFNGANNCTNDTYHDAANGTTEQVFATGGAGSDMGFSEQSFFVNLYGPVNPLYIAPVAWGQQAQPLLYSDTFVTSRATCATGSQCAADAAAFTTMMTGLPMKNYIVESEDLPAGAPWRTLLVAAQSFYSQPQVQNNPVYQQVSKVFAGGQPFPNNFTAQVQADMDYGICTALQAQRPEYVCKTGPGDLQRAAEILPENLRRAVSVLAGSEPAEPEHSPALVHRRRDTVQ